MGWIGPDESERMIASFRRTLPPTQAERQVEMVPFLTMKPTSVSASSPADGDDPYSGFGHLWPLSAASSRPAQPEQTE